MLRHKRNSLVVALISVVALSATVGLFSEYFDRHPTCEEFRVYGGFLNHLAADGHLPQSHFALAQTTLELSDPGYDSWIPAELPSDKTQPSSEFAAFCGLCAQDFVRKNLDTWRLEPQPQIAFGVSVVEPPKPADNSSEQIVWVTRVGFNLWHTRAVLSYSRNCSDESLCLELGEAYLLKQNGVWKVDHYHAITV
jgi:hypothetical protein